MMTPPAKRIATTVVPCGISSVDGPSMPAPGSWCGASRRSTSANDGPGSTSGVKSGNALDSDIGAGAYRRVSACQRTDALAHQRCHLIVPIQIVGGPLEDVELLAKVAEGVIATKAQQPANRAQFVIVIDVERSFLGSRLETDRADALLGLDHDLLVSDRYPVRALQVALAIRYLLAT